MYSRKICYSELNHTHTHKISSVTRDPWKVVSKNLLWVNCLSSHLCVIFDSQLIEAPWNQILIGMRARGGEFHPHFSEKKQAYFLSKVQSQVGKSFSTLDWSKENENNLYCFFPVLSVGKKLLFFFVFTFNCAHILIVDSSILLQENQVYWIPP